MKSYAHTTNFDKLVELVVCCGGDDLKRFIESAGRNATYTSKDTVIEFVEAICQWVEESLKRLHQAPFYSLMEDECTDISTVEVLSIFCCWIEDGLPVEHFMEIVPLKKADAATIFSTLVDYLKQKTYSLASLWGWGLMEQQPSQGKKNWHSAPTEEECFICALSLPSTSTCVCSSC